MREQCGVSVRSGDSMILLALLLHHTFVATIVLQMKNCFLRTDSNLNVTIRDSSADNKWDNDLDQESLSTAHSSLHKATRKK